MSPALLLTLLLPRSYTSYTRHPYFGTFLSALQHCTNLHTCRRSHAQYTRSFPILVTFQALAFSAARSSPACTTHSPLTSLFDTVITDYFVAFDSEVCIASVKGCTAGTSCSVTVTTSISLCMYCQQFRCTTIILTYTENSTVLTQLIYAILSITFFHCFATPIAEYFAANSTLFPLRLRGTIPTVFFVTSRAASQLIIPFIISTVIIKAIVVQALMTSVVLRAKICLTPSIITSIHPKT